MHGYWLLRVSLCVVAGGVVLFLWQSRRAKRARQHHEAWEHRRAESQTSWRASRDASQRARAETERKRKEFDLARERFEKLSGLQLIHAQDDPAALYKVLVALSKEWSAAVAGGRQQEARKISTKYADIRELARKLGILLWRPQLPYRALMHNPHLKLVSKTQAA